MSVVNAITKVRFNSARAQRVQLQKMDGVVYDILCLEPGQDFSVTGPSAYYVVAGAGQFKGSAGVEPLAMGAFAACQDGQAHTIVNTSEQRLICLAVSKH